MTVYIVSGDGPRCGSAMMMRALGAGGMDLVYDEEMDSEAHDRAEGDYHPNVDGLYELTREHQWALGFPGGYEGKVLKVFPAPWGSLQYIVAGDYKVLWLHRAAEERWASFFRMHEKRPLAWCRYQDDPRPKALRDGRAAECLGILRVRGDVEVFEVDYGAVLARPGFVFEMLRKAGWPVDVGLASAVPDSGKRHYALVG